MKRTYIYIYSGDPVFFYRSDREKTAEELQRADGDADCLYGVYDTEEALGGALTVLFKDGYDLLPCDDYIDIVKKYCPPELTDWWRVSDNETINKHRYMIFFNSSEEEISQSLLAGIENLIVHKYGIDPHADLRISRRLEEEWHTVNANRNLLDIAVLWEIAEWMRAEKHPYWLPGSSGSSFLLNLLGITRGDPLPPYYTVCDHIDVLDVFRSPDPQLIPAILWFREYSSCRDGFDAPQLSLQHGAGLYGDGHDIPWQTLWPDSKPSFFEVRLPADLIETFKRWLKDHWLFDMHPELTLECPTPDKICFSHILLHFSLNERICSPVRKDAVPAAVTKAVLEHWRELVTDKAERLPPCPAECGNIPEPQTFSDVVYLFGLLHSKGVPDENILRKAALPGRGYPQTIAFKDDVYQYLKARGLSGAAASLGMRSVAHGHGLPGTIEMMLGSEGRRMRDMCGSIRHLIPKAHAIEYLLFRLTSLQ